MARDVFEQTWTIDATGQVGRALVRGRDKKSKVNSQKCGEAAAVPHPGSPIAARGRQPQPATTTCKASRLRIPTRAARFQEWATPSAALWGG